MRCGSLPQIPFFFGYDMGPIRWPRRPRHTPQQLVQLNSALSHLLSRTRARPAEETEEQRMQASRATAEALITFLGATQRKQRENVASAQRSARPGNDAADEDDEDDEPLLGAPRLLHLRAPRSQSRYVIFSPYTHLALIAGLLIKCVPLKEA